MKRYTPLASRRGTCIFIAQREGVDMFGFEIWELVMIATGAFWGAWFMRRKNKKENGG